MAFRGTRLAVLGAVLSALLGPALVSTSTAYAQVPPAPPPAVSTPLVPEPPALGYIPPFAPATALPATDIRPRVVPRTRLAPGVAPTSVYPCTGYSGIQAANSVPDVRADIFSWSTFAPYKVGNGEGNVGWRLNPYKNVSWYMWFHSLRWVGQAIDAGAAGDLAALDHAGAIVKDWVMDNPYPWTNDVGAHEATMHRTNVLICLREAIIKTAPDGVLPVADKWLDSALLSHASFMQNYWSGPGNNHGTDESIAMLGVGCLLDRAVLRDLAISRLSQAITTTIDAEGSSNEQATSYAQYNYVLWGRAERALTTCNVSTGTTIASRRRLLAGFVAQSTNPLGTLAQIGDSEVVSAVPFQATDAEWAGSQGTLGIAPDRRVSRYQAGYVFGRSGWGTGARPFRQESFYSLRYGPGRKLHGHQDHTSLTYVARGRDILIDGGHPGYVNDQWRTWARSDYAHNVMTVPTATPLPAAATKLARSAILRGADFFEMTDQSHIGVPRTRAVLILHDPDLMVVLDRGFSAKAQQWQTLWHLPSDQNGTVYSRTTAIATKPGDSTQTILFQVPFRQVLPRGATLALRGKTIPTIQGWHFPNITRRDAASTLMFARSGLSASILSVIAPLGVGAGVGYTMTPAANGWTNLDLKVGGTPVRVRISPGNALVRG